MAKIKLSDNVITSEDISSYLATKDDFSLELRVYSTAKKLGFNATHGGTYLDSLSRKRRQYDIRASKVREEMRIDLAIECKALSSAFPLIVQRIPRVEEESFHNLVVSSSSVADVLGLTTREREKNSETIGIPSNLYPKNELVGKATTQIGRKDQSQFISNDNETYEKWSQALCSAGELIQLANKQYEKSPTGTMTTCIIPILVVSNETLWVTDHHEDGSVIGEPRKTDETTLFIGSEHHETFGIYYTVSHLHIFTEIGITRFLKKIDFEDEIWRSIFPRNFILGALMSTKFKK